MHKRSESVQRLNFNRSFYFLGAFSAIAFSAALPGFSESVDIQIQIEDYVGEEAYFAVYLADPDGRYQRTLWISGTDPKYHTDLAGWWRYASRSDEDFDAITGASTASGGRVLVRTELSETEISGKYKVVVATAVENQSAVPQDAAVLLAEDSHGEKFSGTDYVRFIRYKW